MMDGPHIFGFSPEALFIIATSALASAWRVLSNASINAATLTLVGLILLSAIRPPLLFASQMLNFLAGCPRPRCTPAVPATLRQMPEGVNILLTVKIAHSPAAAFLDRLL